MTTEPPDPAAAIDLPELATATELTEAARQSQEPWATTMEEAAPAVALIADLARSAGFRPDQEVMTHGDIDQKTSC